MNFKTHKDKLPQVTINEIRAILSELGIFTLESHWHSAVNNCYSVNLSFNELGCYSNGKGITEEYALASAYAEFIERLQAVYLLPNNFGIMENDNLKDSFDIETTLGAFAEENKSIIDNTLDLKVVEECDEIKIKLFPSFDVLNGDIKYLPYFINAACSSNGICAGNTAEEAICQGMCEIFERFIIREIYSNENIDFPTIPLSVLKDLEIYRIIEKIIKKGYWLIIKDCTLNGKFPVVGVIMMNKNKSSYLYRFGSDPIFEVALQRCLTELFQGISDSSLIKEFVNRVDYSNDQFSGRFSFSEEDSKKFSLEKSINWGNDILPNHIFTSKNETVNFRKGFQEEFKNHKDSLEFLTGIIKNNNYKMYVHNLSTLGFPSFRIYIPELTSVRKIFYDKFKFYFIEINFIKKVLLRLKKASIEDIEKCVNLLESLLNIPEDYYSYKYRFSVSNTILNLIVDKSSHIRLFDNLWYLLGMLFFRVGNYEKAFKYLNQYIKEFGKDFSNLDYYNCVLLYLKLKIEKKSENEIRIILKNTFGDVLSKEIINDLANPEDCFKYFILPECGDCTLCPIKKECRYEKWKDINTKIVQKINSNPIKQEDLGEIFQNLIINNKN